MMRVRKLLKVTAISLFLLALLLLFLFTYFVFNPFEGSLTEMRDVVPRGVDFYARKVRLREDFTLATGTVETDRFPYVPALDRIGQNPAWTRLKQGSWYQKLGVGPALRSVRQEFEKLSKDVSAIHLVDDIIGREVLVAGYLGRTGFEDSRWCLYTRVSWRGKAALGLMARSFVREQMSQQGLILGDHAISGCYTLKIRQSNLDLLVGRYKDCLMVSNDPALFDDSMKLADGNREKEPLGPSAHLKDGVTEPQREWAQRVNPESFSAVEWHLQPRQLFPQDWLKSIADDDRNAKVLASFLNPPSYRFLSGSLIFEPNSFTLLSHLVVNGNMLTPFQKSLFDSESTLRAEWMDQFFSMVPREACGAAALKMPAGEFVREMFKDALVEDERGEINRAIRATRKYKGMDDLIDQIGISLQPRVGVIFRPNRRTDGAKETFSVPNPSPFPQWAWVFWIKKHRKSNRVLNDSFQDLINHINQNRRAYGITNAFKLGLTQGGVQSDVAFEFAMPFVPGTGSIAMATVGEYFIFANSGPFIYSMVQSMVGRQKSRRGDRDFEEFVSEMPPAVNGVAFVWSDQLTLVAEDFEVFAKGVAAPMNQSWAIENRPRAEQQVFRDSKWRRYGTMARIPGEERPAFEQEVDKAVDEMYRKYRATQVVGDVATLQQFRDLVGTFRSAYLQMVLTEESLRIWGRVLSPEYNR